MTLLDPVLQIVVILIVAATVFFAWREVIGLSPTRLWALASQTFRESVRRRVLLLIPGAMALIVLIGLFQHGINQVSEIHQATGACIRISAALTLLLMILLSASSFPREIETRTIYSLLTKPVTRLEVFLGKVLGLWLLAAVVLALMGAFSYGYLRVRAGQLTAKALVQYERDRRDYEKSLTQATTQPVAAPLNRWAQPAVAPPAPPDEALKQHVDLGLLTALNYLDSPTVRPHPLVTDEDARRAHELTGGDCQWILTGHGYLGLYSVDLPPMDQRPGGYEIKLALDIPAAGEDERLWATVRLVIPHLTAETRVQATEPAPAVVAAGWTAGIDQPRTFDLRHEDDNLWHGRVSLTGDFAAIGSVTKLGISIEAFTGGRLPRLVGLIQPGGSGPHAVAGLELIPQTEVPSPPLRPDQLLVIPRSQAIRRFPVGGSPPEGPTEVAEYQFDHIPLDALPDGDLVFQLKFSVDKGSPPSVDTRAVVVALGPPTQRETVFTSPSTRMSSFVHIRRDLARDGRVTLQIRPQQPDDSFTLAVDSVRLLVRPTPVPINLGKSLLVCQIEAMVVVTLGVMGSVFLSWPVALLLNSVLLIAGNLLDMVRGLLSTPGGAQIFSVTGEDKSIDLASQVANEFFKHSSRLIERIVPDYTRFDPQAFISQGLNIPWPTLGVAGAWALAYVGVAMAIGYLTLHFKEVAK